MGDEQALKDCTCGKCAAWLLEAGLRLRDFGRLLFLHGSRFASKLKAGARCIVLHVVREVPRAGQRLAGIVALTTG